MSKILRPAALAVLLFAGTAYAFAQAQNPDGDRRPLPPTAGDNQPYDKKSEPTNATPPAATNDKAPDVGSRAIGPPVDTRPETPADRNTTDLKKLDKQGRGGQQN